MISMFTHRVYVEKGADIFSGDEKEFCLSIVAAMKSSTYEFVLSPVHIDLKVGHAQTQLWVWMKSASSDLFRHNLVPSFSCNPHHVQPTYRSLGTKDWLKKQCVFEKLLEEIGKHIKDLRGLNSACHQVLRVNNWLVGWQEDTEM